MAKTKLEQMREAVAKTPEGWNFNTQKFFYWNEKEIFTDSEPNENGVFYRLQLNYTAETNGEGWSRKATGRQIPTIELERYTPTAPNSDMCSVVNIFKKSIGEIQKNKKFNYLLQLAPTLDTVAYFNEAKEKDTGKKYNDMSDFFRDDEQDTETTAEQNNETDEGEEIPTEAENEPQETQEVAKDEPQTPDAASDMFAMLAQAYITGKQTPPQPHKPEQAQEVTAEPEPLPAPIPTTPEHPTKAAGYDGEVSDLFNDEEIEKLLSGEQVRKISGINYNYNHVYIATKYTQHTSLLYGMHNFKDEPLQAGSNFEYIGFISGGKVYTEKAIIDEAIKEDVNAEILRQLPNEAAAMAFFDELEEYEQKQIEEYKGYSREAQARELFYKGEKLQFNIFTAYHRNETEIIKYIESPAAFIKSLADDFISTHKAAIIKYFIEFRQLAEAYNAIVTDSTHEAHTLKRISDSIGEGMKTARVELIGGECVRVESHAIKYITNGYGIYNSYVLAADRNKLPLNEYNRPADIKAADIKAIYHGNKLLYSA